MRSVLMVRIDKIGDLVLTLPVDQIMPHIRTKWWIPTGLSFLAASCQKPRQFSEIARRFSWSQFSKLYQELRSEKPDAVIIFHAPAWVYVLMFLARIPVRVGVLSQWHSFLFLNAGVRQKRSQAQTSEFEYNVQLVQQGLGLTTTARVLPLQIHAHSQPRVDQFMARHQLLQNKFFVVHPGMKGSARNWSTANYRALIEQLAQQGPVVITGTASDTEYLQPLSDLWVRFRTGPFQVISAVDQFGGDELLDLLSRARSVLAPSTGVLHLSAALGQKTVGIYSPIRVQHPRRWRPFGARADWLVPQVECPAEKKCLGPACAEFDCMNKIQVEQVYQKLVE